MNVVVLGAGLAGLSAAIYAATSGHDVTVLEKNATPGGKLWVHAEDGFTFDMGPSMIIEKWIIDEVLDLAGHPRITFEEVTPTLSVHMDDTEVRISRENLADVLAEHASEDAEAFLKINEKMRTVIKHVRASFFEKPVNGFWGVMNPHLLRIASLINPRDSASQFAQKNFSNSLLTALLSTFPSYSEHDIQDSPAIACFVPFLMIQEGIWYPKGGVYTIAEEMYHAAKKLGVQFRFNTPVHAIDVENDAVRGVFTDRDVKADAVISTIDYAYTQKLLGREREDTDAAHAYYALALGITKELPFTHHTFLIPESYEQAHELIDSGHVPDEFPLYLCVASKTDEGTAPECCENVLAVAVLPSTQEVDWESKKEEVACSIVSQIERMTEELIADDISVRRILAPDEFERTFNNTGGSVFGLSGVHNPFVGFREYNKDKQVFGLYYAGATVQPGSGVPLVIRSGKFAVDLMNAD